MRMVQVCQINLWEESNATYGCGRYWGHEHNNVENLVSIRLGGIVPRPTALSRAAPLSPGGDQKVARDETGSEAVLKDDFVTQPSSPTSVSDDNKCLPQYRDLDDAQDAALTPGMSSILFSPRQNADGGIFYARARRFHQ